MAFLFFWAAKILRKQLQNPTIKIEDPQFEGLFVGYISYIPQFNFTIFFESEAFLITYL